MSWSMSKSKKIDCSQKSKDLSKRVECDSLVDCFSEFLPVRRKSLCLDSLETLTERKHSRNVKLFVD